MKYITLQINKINGSYVIENIYTPACSIGETVYLRVITGNFRPDTLSAIIVGDRESSRVGFKETYPTVFDLKLNERLCKGLLTETITKFKARIFINSQNNIKEVMTDEIIKILGVSFGQDSVSDISNIYRILNELRVQD